MHDTYGFLVNYDPRLDPKDFADEVVGDFHFNYFEPVCNCNNYWSALALVLSTGVVIPLAKKDDEKELQDRLMFISQQERWDAAYKLCLTGCGIAARIDGVFIGDATLEVFNQKVQTMSVNELTQYLRTQVSNNVVSTLEETIQVVRGGGDIEAFVCRSQHSLESQIAIQSAHFVPFSGALYPPETQWRCYDLRADLQADLGILFVDIHT